MQIYFVYQILNTYYLVCIIVYIILFVKPVLFITLCGVTISQEARASSATAAPKMARYCRLRYCPSSHLCGRCSHNGIYILNVDYEKDNQFNSSVFLPDMKIDLIVYD